MTPLAPSLVRLWDEAWQEQAGDFVMWHRGFRVAADHQLAVPLLRADPLEMGRFNITVYSTDELIWKVDKWEQNRNDEGEVRVYCRPYVEVIRQRLMPDEHLREKWLAAERKFFTESVAELDRIRAELAQAQEGASMWGAVTNMFGRMR